MLIVEVINNKNFKAEWFPVLLLNQYSVGCKAPRVSNFCYCGFDTLNFSFAGAGRFAIEAEKANEPENGSSRSTGSKTNTGEPPMFDLASNGNVIVQDVPSPRDNVQLQMFQSIIDRETERVNRNVGRARQYGLPATLTLAEWLWILNRFEYSCAYCKKKYYEEMDHVVPLSHGGPTTMHNVVPCCTDCNRERDRVYQQTKSVRAKLSRLHIDLR